jgi:hypothetical protein
MAAAVMRFIVAPTVRSNSDEDGTTILEITQNKIYSLVGIGSLVWQQLANSRAGLVQVDIVRQLKNEFSAVSPHQIETDVAAILSSLKQRRLIQSTECRAPQRPLRESVSNVVKATVLTSVHFCSALKLRVAAALSLLLLIDLLLKFGRFGSLYSLVENWPVSAPGERCETQEQVLEDVTTALSIYPKQAMCLQRSAVATCILRGSGIPAQMVIGCQRHPFIVHAWTEVDETVVNDRQNVKQTHSVMDRL